MNLLVILYKATKFNRNQTVKAFEQETDKKGKQLNQSVHDLFLSSTYYTISRASIVNEYICR